MRDLSLTHSASQKPKQPPPKKVQPPPAVNLDIGYYSRMMSYLPSSQSIFGHEKIEFPNENVSLSVAVLHQNWAYKCMFVYYYTLIFY